MYLIFFGEFGLVYVECVLVFVFYFDDEVLGCGVLLL